MKLLILKLELRKDKFLLAEALKEDCKKLSIKYSPTIAYLLRKKYLIRILRGVFYIKSIEERKFNKTNISHYEALKKAFELKGVKNWYFGLDTAVKLNNLTHEYFTTDYVISDSIFRPKPINVMGHIVKFIKLKKKLLKFGIITKEVNFSDPEKTFLDIIYLDKYKGFSEETIKSKVEDMIATLFKKRVRRYLKHYPLSVRRLVRRMQWYQKNS
ncbi:MAG: hypothetical protein AABX39_05940 [Nanoarchaeota archaeon]